MKYASRSRLCRLLLYFFPRRFRERHGDDLVDIYEDLYHRPGRFAGLTFFASAVVDALTCGSAARWEAWRHPAPGSSRRLGPIERMNMFLQNLRTSVRILSRRPAFTAVVLITLALGIGANSGLFSVINAVLLRPLPYAEPDRLVRLIGVHESGRRGPISYPNFEDYRDQAEILTTAAAFDEWQPTLTGDGDPERVTAALVNWDFFSVLGVEPARGRFFTAEEDIDGQDRVVILTDGFWRRRFGADPEVLGRRILLGARPHEVVGILPPSFEDPRLSGRGPTPELFRPLGLNGLPEGETRSRSGRSFTAIARLAGDTGLAAAQAEITALGARLAEQYPEDNAGHRVDLVPLADSMVGHVRHSLLILLGAVGFVLAIAAANVVNLLLSRASDRRSEIALRAALGAGRRQLIAQFLTESLVLVTAGTLLGSIVAHATTRVLVTLGGEAVPRAEVISIDARVMGFTVVIALLTAFVCGLVPAFLATDNLQSPLRSASAGLFGDRSRGRLRQALVVAEVALSLTLLTSAGLLVRSLWKLERVDTGLQADSLLTFELMPPYATYPDDASLKAFYGPLLERLSGLPGVESVASTSLLPLSGSFDGNSVAAEDQPPPAPGEALSAQSRTVTPGYFETMGMTLKSGRPLLATDVAGGPQVAVISQALATLLWPGENAVGRRLITHETSCEVVGVLADVKHLGLDEPAPPRVYIARAQALAPWQIQRRIVALRTSLDPLTLVPAIRREVWALDPRLPLSDVRTMEQVVTRSAAAPRFRTVLLASFAALALVLAAVGIFGVLSYSVNERRRDLAVRMALGAERRAVLRHVVHEGLRPVVIGLGIGLAAALAVTRWLESLLFGVSTTDPASFFAVPCLLLGVALVASFLPAHRATRIDPMSTLRAS